MNTEATDKPVTQAQLDAAIANLRTELIDRMGQMEIRLIDRIHRLESIMVVQTIILLGAILAAAKYLH